MNHQRINQKTQNTVHILANAVLFQICWFVAILAGGYWALIPLLLMCCHYVFYMGAKYLRPVLLLSLVGILIDSAYLGVNIYTVTETSALVPFLGLPVWLACLWIGFCACLPVSLAWLLKEKYWFVLLTTVMGPISYIAGRRLGAIDFTNSSLLWIVAEWLLIALLTLFIFRSDSTDSQPRALRPSGVH